MIGRSAIALNLVEEVLGLTPELKKFHLHTGEKNVKEILLSQKDVTIRNAQVMETKFVLLFLEYFLDSEIDGLFEYQLIIKGFQFFLSQYSSL